MGSRTSSASESCVKVSATCWRANHRTKHKHENEMGLTVSSSSWRGAYDFLDNNAILCLGNVFGKLMLFATLMLWGAYGYWRDVERPDGLDSARRDANKKRE